MPAEWHFCWVGPQTRVRRMGSAMECLQCRRYKAKHKCGARPDARTAWCDYPVEDCAACSSRYDKGEFPDGTPPNVKPVRPSEVADSYEPKNRTSSLERRAKRAEERRQVANRRTLIMTAVLLGYEEATALYKVLRAFGVQTSGRTIRDDLEELVKLSWLTRYQVVRQRKNACETPWQWCYKLNPAVRERIQNAGTGAVQNGV